jgi:SAM-dependent methyltransferase
LHPEIFQAFEKICRERRAGGDVLEVGAVQSEDSLLTMKALRGARSKTGVNLTGGGTYSDFRILEANANDLGFPDASFDTVICNAVLEHDPFFWLSLAEMKRVARPGGLVVIGVPGFIELSVERAAQRMFRLPVLGRMLRRAGAGLAASTLTLRTHQYPGDYYRFSPQAMLEVFFPGFHDVQVQSLMVPPRVIGGGIKR